MSHLLLPQLRLSKGWITFAAALCVVMIGLALIVSPEHSLIATVLLSIVLAWLAAIDLDRSRLPDILTLPLIVAGIAYTFAIEGPVIHCIIGALLGYGVFWAVSYIAGSILKKPALGLGDAKLLAALGAWVGWAALPTIVLIGSIVGLAHALVFLWRTGRKSSGIPFGPSLIAGFWTVWLAGPIGGSPY